MQRKLTRNLVGLLAPPGKKQGSAKIYFENFFSKLKIGHFFFVHFFFSTPFLFEKIFNIYNYFIYSIFLYIPIIYTLLTSMNFITKAQFLRKFRESPADKQTLAQFIKSAKVSTNRDSVTLVEYMKSNNIKRENIEMLYNAIKSRMEYLARFYDTSLRVDESNIHIHENEMPMKKNELNNNTKVQYKNLIRNLHFQHILKKTKSGLENLPSFLTVILDFYTKNKIDYKIVTPSSLFYVKNGRLGSVFSSLYFRASILNPYFIYSLNMSVLKGTRIFSPTLGWSSYLHGFFQCPMVTEYVGTDVIPDVCEKTKLLGNHYNKKCEIFCKPSENLLNTPFLKKYKEHFDLVFFSPPYYRLELYDSDNQSTHKYTSYESWLINYWEKTVNLCAQVLQDKGKMCYILSGYGSHNTQSFIDLITDMNNITKKYFTYLKTMNMQNKNVHATNHRETGEHIIIFRKK